MTTEIKKVVLYHGNCPDGFTSAWAAYQKMGDTSLYIPVHHGNPYPEEIKDAYVFILDFCYEENELREIVEKAEKVVVLDHHVSRVPVFEKLFDEGIISGEMNMNKSGAMLAWEAFHPSTPAPLLVEYVQDRDLWKFDLEHSGAINRCIMSYEYSFENWDHINRQLGSRDRTNDAQRSLFENFLMDGKAIVRHQTKIIRSMAEDNKLRLTIGGIDMPAINVFYAYGSDICNYVVETTSDTVCAYFYINGRGTFNFGLRSSLDGPDVSKIAAEYGGGGHKHASGFQVNSLNDL